MLERVRGKVVIILFLPVSEDIYGLNQNISLDCYQVSIKIAK